MTDRQHLRSPQRTRRLLWEVDSEDSLASNSRERQRGLGEEHHRNMRSSCSVLNLGVHFLGDSAFYNAFTNGLSVTADTFLGYERYIAVVTSGLYLINHRISRLEIQQLLFRFHPDSTDFAEKAKEIVAKTQRWQARILSNSVLRMARELRHQLLLRNINIITLAPREQKQHILSLWSQETCIRMYSCLQNIVDFKTIFHPPRTLQNRLQYLRIYLQHIFYLAMLDALVLRLGEAEANPREAIKLHRQAFQRWRVIRNHPTEIPEVPDIRDIPFKPDRLDRLFALSLGDGGNCRQ